MRGGDVDETSLDCLDTRRLSEQRIGNGLVEFDRFVADAAGLHAVAKVIYDEGYRDA